GQTKVEIAFKPEAAPAAVAPAMEPLGRLLCPNVPAAPSIDGHLDDACWQNAGRVEAFVDARTGHAPPVKTVARLASDANNLYVAFECFETDLRLARECQFGADLSDAPVWLDEAVSVCIDQDHDHGTFFQIAVNAAGASADWKCTPQADWGWHSKARVKTTVLADRWCVEMAIPKRTLTEVENDIWAFGLGRRRHAPGCDGRRLGVNCQCPQFVLAPPGPLEAFKGLEAAGQPGVASGRFPDAFWHLVFSKNTCFVSDITRLDLSYGENVFMAQVANVTAAPLDVVASLGLSFGDKPKRTNYKITLPANHTTEFGFPFQLSPYGAPRQYGGSPYGAPRQYGGKAIGRCTLAFVLLNAKTNEPLATVVRNGLETPAPLSLTVEPVHYLDEPRAVGRAALQLTPEAMQNTRLRATVWPLGKKPALATIQAEVLWGRADIVVPLDGLKPGAFELEVALVKDGQDVFSRRNAFVKCDGPFPDMP
ncbi:MAG: hypothetical protein FJ279_22725, partial [Planctomycetes bacterium]|nr:hypothetical protein [Planctomycetota bacterium]